MLPLNITEPPLTQQAADRQTNYLILRSLESKLPQDQFKALLNQVSSFFSNFVVQVAPTMTLPHRTVWDGSELPSSYEELKQR